MTLEANSHRHGGLSIRRLGIVSALGLGDPNWRSYWRGWLCCSEASRRLQATVRSDAEGGVVTGWWPSQSEPEPSVYANVLLDLAGLFVAADDPVMAFEALLAFQFPLLLDGVVELVDPFDDLGVPLEDRFPFPLGLL